MSELFIGIDNISSLGKIKTHLKLCKRETQNKRM